MQLLWLCVMDFGGVVGGGVVLGDDVDVDPDKPHDVLSVFNMKVPVVVDVDHRADTETFQLQVINQRRIIQPAGALKPWSTGEGNAGRKKQRHKRVAHKGMISELVESEGSLKGVFTDNSGWLYDLVRPDSHRVATAQVLSGGYRGHGRKLTASHSIVSQLFMYRDGKPGDESVIPNSGSRRPFEPRIRPNHPHFVHQRKRLKCPAQTGFKIEYEPLQGLQEHGHPILRP